MIRLAFRFGQLVRLVSGAAPEPVGRALINSLAELIGRKARARRQRNNAYVVRAEGVPIGGRRGSACPNGIARDSEMTQQPGFPRWLTAIGACLDEHGRKGGFIAKLTRYHPALVEEMARALGLAHVDFRAARLKPLGWDAARLPLTAIDDAIADGIAPSGLVLQNAEALLASKPAGERRAFLSLFVDTPRDLPVIIPIAAHESDVPAPCSRVIEIDADEAPEESLLLRLARK